MTFTEGSHVMIKLSLSQIIQKTIERDSISMMQFSKRSRVSINTLINFLEADHRDSLLSSLVYILLALEIREHDLVEDIIRSILTLPTDS